MYGLYTLKSILLPAVTLPPCLQKMNATDYLAWFDFKIHTLKIIMNCSILLGTPNMGPFYFYVNLLSAKLKFNRWVS